ncbi:hypothetical protein G6F68_013889 [Rhizopus microsporus]|nr:hypothetical protein G6F68_013889 [Rhizopus microsporus]
MRLRFHPRAQPGLQGPVRQFERPGRQSPCVIRRQHARLAVGDGDKHGNEFGMDGAFDGFGQVGRSVPATAPCKRDIAIRLSAGPTA